MEYCPTDEMTADIGTKPLQGSKFRKFRDRLLNNTAAHYAIPLASDPQECVETCNHVQGSVDEQTTSSHDSTSETSRTGSDTNEWILVTRGKHGGNLKNAEDERNRTIS